MDNETVWLTQKGMAQLFDVEVNTINYHLKEIYSSGELSEMATIRKIRTVQTEGQRQVERERIFYSLDAVISVGYRVNSRKATLFRQPFNDYKILPDRGSVSHAQARVKAESEYDLFNPTQRIDSDFDKATREMLDKD